MGFSRGRMHQVAAARHVPLNLLTFTLPFKLTEGLTPAHYACREIGLNTVFGYYRNSPNRTSKTRQVAGPSYMRIKFSEYEASRWPSQILRIRNYCNYNNFSWSIHLSGTVSKLFSFQITYIKRLGRGLEHFLMDFNGHNLSSHKGCPGTLPTSYKVM